MRACLLALGLASCVAPTVPAPLPARTVDVFGGTSSHFVPTGFFRVEQTDARWWLVSPAGGAFLSFGVTTVTPDGDWAPALERAPFAEAVRAKYGTDAAWADATVQRFHDWGLNTLGAWSRDDLFRGRVPFTVNLSLASADWVTGQVPDYFSPAWAASVQQRAHARLASLRDDPWLVGTFLDNELRWGRDWRAPRDELLRDYLRLPPEAPGKQALVAFFAQQPGGLAGFNDAWGTQLASFAELTTLTELPRTHDTLALERAFLAVVAERFFTVTTEAVRAEAPNHLVLGCRFVSVLTPPEVLEAAARHVDVLSVNAYTFVEGVDTQTAQLFGPVVDASNSLARFSATGRPILISEFGFRARDSQLPNSWPPIYPTLETQVDRAAAFEGSVRRAFRNPALVGVHWFEWADEPAAGRFDGEDNNFGLVSATDEPWAPLVERMREVFTSVLEARVASLP